MPQRIEEDILKWWEAERVYSKTRNRFKGNPKFYFVDGPPYVTNPPHVGTAWNKILKDVVIRFRRMRGQDVRDQPGYDCHGLPIEVKVEEDLGIKAKKDIEEKITIEKFIEKCKQYAVDNVAIQTSTFKNMGVWMDWERPYVTFENDYIESVWWTLKQANEKGLLTKGLRVVHWCPRCETALAGYEVTDEYRTVKDYSIFVKFPVQDVKGEYILIWTTTPWTLPANTAVMVNPNHMYVKARVGDDLYILAETRCSPIFSEFGFEYEILQRLKGEELEGLRYVPPLIDEVTVQSQIKDAHMVLLSSEYVSMEEGTGCVHMAPGHGEEDFEVGLKHNLPIICPVDQSGVFTIEAGKYKGKRTAEANTEIVKDLDRKGLLFREAIVEHAFPHCWRCKTPLILRATDQWFLKISDFRNRLVEENEKILWVPDWAGSKRFKDWLLGARDWVISRQRYWGVPLPIWLCERCEMRIVIGSKDELREKSLDFPREVDLHRNCVDNIKLKCDCGGAMVRVPDIVDVWMDSGVASWACLRYPKEASGFETWWPADFITEAHDQTRGWFYTQLGASMIAFNRAPYKCVMMHGHTLDSLGRKMSKSLGNFVSPEDVIAKYGRDALRLYELQCTVWEDFRFSWNGVEDALKTLRVVWNIFAFASLYMGLDRFSPAKWPLEKTRGCMRPEDRWIISRTESLKKLVSEELENFNIHLASRALVEYALEDLSHWYVRLIRRRFWQERESIDKMAAYSVLYHALKSWLLLSAPIVPFITEKLYQLMIRSANTGALQSIHMCEYPRPKLELVDMRLEEQMKIVKEVVAATASARQKLNIKRRQPLSKVVVVTDRAEVESAIKTFERAFIEQANVKVAQFITTGEEEKLKKVNARPRYEALGPVFKDQAPRVGEIILTSSGKRIADSFREKGAYEISLGGRIFQLTPDMVEFREEMPDNFAAAEFDRGRVYVEITVPNELAKEGLVRDVVRRLQEMRRRMNLEVEAYVVAHVSTPTMKERRWLDERRKYIKQEVRAKRLFLTEKGARRPKPDLLEKWVIGNKEYEMGLSLVRPYSCRNRT